MKIQTHHQVDHRGTPHNNASQFFTASRFLKNFTSAEDYVHSLIDGRRLSHPMRVNGIGKSVLLRFIEPSVKPSQLLNSTENLSDVELFEDDNQKGDQSVPLKAASHSDTPPQFFKLSYGARIAPTSSSLDDEWIIERLFSGSENDFCSNSSNIT
jgi:hypothetical protein